MCFQAGLLRGLDMTVVAGITIEKWNGCGQRRDQSVSTLTLLTRQQGQAAGQFWLPNSVFISKENMIYVADSYNRRIQVFRYVGDDT